MVFYVLRPDGTREARRHTPWNMVQKDNQEWHAIHAGNGRLLARDFVSAAHLEQSMAGRTEPVPHFKG